MQDERKKYLINCLEGAARVERASVSFILALSAAQDSETAVFVTSDAADLCRRGGADGLVAPGMPPLAELITRFVERGGMIWLCPLFAREKGITEDQLIEGCEIAGARRLLAFMDSGARLLA